MKVFPDEDKESPLEVVRDFLNAEEAIAKLQTAQARYNLTVVVEVPGPLPGIVERITLSEAIKKIGGVARAEKMWRSAANPKSDRYGDFGTPDEIDPTKVRSKATVSTTQAIALASAIAKRAGSIRAAIATANATEVEIEGLTPDLFE